jgi:CheY-like chemotaxis protein
MKHHKSNELTVLQEYIETHSKKFTLANWCSPESLDLTSQQVDELLDCVQAALPAHLAVLSKLILAFQASTATSDAVDMTCKFASIQIYTPYSEKPLLHCGVQILDNKIVVENITIRPLAETRKFSLSGSDIPLIIIADDDLMVLTMLKHWITKTASQQYETLSVNNGNEAFSAYQANYHCACIFMDLQMPVMDGLEAIRKIREFEANHHLPAKPITLMSASAQNDDILAKHNIQAFIAKPFTKKTCLEAVDNMVNNYSTEEYGESRTSSPKC